ncbi:unnamed protein product [Protopolystoma xenopodis]|uniref:Uncharacterized protein n=1 Tax=Protopolystoma xenopodis TaxID=117903 RepID=A0A3S5CV25_9PLAT|nr:unnamed protein product [Protopolystoma xenopodis]
MLTREFYKNDTSSDDVHHMMDKRSARFHPKRGRKSRGLRQHEYCIKAKRLQYNEMHPSSSGEIDQRIASSCTFIRNECPPNHTFLLNGIITTEISRRLLTRSA